MASVSDTIAVSGIRCERCVMRLAGALQGHEGLEAANADLMGRVTLTWDDERTSREALVERLARPASASSKLEPSSPPLPLRVPVPVAAGAGRLAAIERSSPDEISSRMARAPLRPRSRSRQPSPSVAASASGSARP